MLKNAKHHVKELEDHIKEGENLVEEKEKNIEEIDEDVKKTNPGDVAQAKGIVQEKKEKKAAKKE